MCEKKRKNDEMQRMLFIKEQMKPYSSEKAFFENFVHTIERIHKADQVQPEKRDGKTGTT